MRTNWKDDYESLLKKLRACDEARRHAHDSTAATFAEFWNGVERADWLLWLAAKLLDRKVVVLAACACARTALKHVKAGEERPRVAIEMAERWCRGEATQQKVSAAADADAAADAVADAADAARTKALRAMADIVRQTITSEMIESVIDLKLQET